MTKRLWDGYWRVMRGYGAKLKRLLAKGWTDSYGEKSMWQTSFGWMENVSTSRLRLTIRSPTARPVTISTESLELSKGLA